MRTTTVDSLLRGVGVGSAVLAGGFAVYMHSPAGLAPDLRGVEHLGVFAQLKGKPAGGAETTRRSVAPALPHDVDPVITGSVAEVGPAIDAPAGRPVLGEFRVLAVEAGVARIRGRDGEWKARRGAVLPGAGRVLDIERRGGRWIVLTTLGVIAD